MKRLLICLLVLLLTVPALAEAPSALRPRRDEIIEEAPQVALSGVRFEGEGYESPEEAVAAYLQAKKNGDAAGMLATFAIETYVENVDAQASLWRVRAFMPGNSALPLGGDHQLQMAAAKRYAELANTLYYQWLALSWPEGYGEFGAQAVMFQDEAEVEAFRAALAENDVAPLLETLEACGLRCPGGAHRGLPVAKQSEKPGAAGRGLRLRRTDGCGGAPLRRRRGMTQRSTVAPATVTSGTTLPSAATLATCWA